MPLLPLKAQYTRYPKPEDWIFASPVKDGQKRYWPCTLYRAHPEPTAKAASISGKTGWHTFLCSKQMAKTSIPTGTSPFLPTLFYRQAALVLWFGRRRWCLLVMVMVKSPANPPACALGDFACSLGGANADVLAGNDRALSDIACCVYGVEGDEITRTFPDSLGCGAGALGCSFADVSCTAANVATGTARSGWGWA